MKKGLVVVNVTEDISLYRLMESKDSCRQPQRLGKRLCSCRRRRAISYKIFSEAL